MTKKIDSMELHLYFDVLKGHFFFYKIFYLGTIITYLCPCIFLQLFMPHKELAVRVQFQTCVWDTHIKLLDQECVTKRTDKGEIWSFVGGRLCVFVCWVYTCYFCYLYCALCIMYNDKAFYLSDWTRQTACLVLGRSQRTEPTSMKKEREWKV